MSSTADPRLINQRSAPKKAMRASWSDPKFRAIVAQVGVIGLVVLVAWYLAHNTIHNMEVQHIAAGLGFIDRIAGFPISESLISYDPATDTYGRALVIGVLNTLKIALVGIVLTTILGTFIGIGRLSKNWLVARIAGLYVEVVRDIPVLLQLLVWYALLSGLPGPRQAINIGNAIFLSSRGLKVPLLVWDEAYWWTLGAFVLGIIGTWIWNRAADRRLDLTGAKPAVWPAAVGLIIVFPLAVWAALGAPFAIEYPELHGFNFQGGGTISPEYVALETGLVVYTAAYIAEIVRSGIQAVPQGQWEAAGALGLRPAKVLSRIILPQALRVIVPPMTSQYLNITKNSSLAVAIGYQDIVSISETTLNQTGQAVEGVSIIMVVFLAISLSISLFMNWYNKRIALTER
jgi:general L-amino acid transport system permease protein